MSNQITTAMVDSFRSSVDMLVQQEGSMLSDKVRVENVVGEKHYFDQIGSVVSQERTSRHGDTPLIETPHSRRQVISRTFDVSDLVDEPDALKVLMDPANAYSKNMALAQGRKKDDVIIEALLGTASTGRSGASSETWPYTNAKNNSHQIAHGGVGLTQAKIRTAHQRLLEMENPTNEPWYLALTAQQWFNLFGESAPVSFTSSDFANDMFRMAKLPQFLGFLPVHTELLTISGSTRSCIAWRKSAVLLAYNKDTTARISERADKNYSLQVFHSMTLGATRMEGDGVVEIQCTEV